MSEIRTQLVNGLREFADRIEIARGKRWLKCTAENPCCKKLLDDGTRVYHPDAQVVSEDDTRGHDTQYQCPHCKLSWWVECDG